MRAAQLATRCFVALVLAASVLCAIVFVLGAENFGVLATIQYLPFPVFLVPLLAALGLAFFVGRAWRVACLMVLALVTTTVMGFEFHESTIGSDRFRVMTFNIKGYLTLDHPGGAALIAREIALYDPDILVLQDAGMLTEFESRHPGALRSIFGGQRMHFEGEYFLVSRYPFRDCAVHPVPQYERLHGHLRCVVLVRGTEIDVMTAHLMTPRFALNAAREGQIQAIEDWKENHAQRMSQAEALAADVRASRRPIVVAGDFNAPESSLVVRTLIATDLRDAFSTAGKGFGYTWGHSLRPGISFLRIDHIFASPGIRIGDCFVGGKDASAHRPVIADLFLNMQRS